MSSDYRLNLIWTSHGAQLRADIERNVGGLVGFDRQVRSHTRNLGLWGQQMRAVGTTIRYALAGATVYGVATAVTGLGQFLDRLGEIDALAGKIEQGGRLTSLGRDLNDVGDIAVNLSNTFGIAVDDIQQHMIRFYSSFGNDVRGRQGLSMLREYADTMAEITMFAEGADPQALGGGIAGMIIGATPAGQRVDIARQAPRMRDIIAQVLQSTPTVRGEDIARDIGRLGAAQTAARMTPEEIWAVYGLAARSGGSPAVIGRGVTQLLADEIIRPQTEDQQRAFRQVGLPTDPTRLRELGGFQILERMMRAVAPGGARFSNPQALGVEGLSPEAAVAAAGGRGINLTLASQLFGQQESFRQFLNLMAQGGTEALQDFIDSIEMAKDANLGEQMADQRNRQRAYQQLGQVQRNVGLTVARGVDPALRPLVHQINELGRWITRQNPTAVAGGVGAAGGAALASRLIFGAGLMGMAGRGMAKIPGLNKLAGRFPGLMNRAPQLAAAAVVGSGLDAFQATGVGEQRAGSRANPYWVVVDPLSWFMPGAPSGMGGGEGTVAGGGRSGRPRPPAWLLGAGFAGSAAALAAGITQIPGATRTGDAEMQHRARFQQWIAQARGAGATRTAALFQRAMRMDDPANLGEFEKRVFRLGMTNPRAAERMLTQAQMRRQGGGGVGAALTVEGGTVVKFVTTPAMDKLLRIADREPFVPVKLINVQPAPRFRGQQKTQRRAPGGR